MIGPRRGIPAAVCVVVLAFLVGTASGAVPDGPRIAFTVDPVESTDGNALKSAGPNGGDIRTLGSALGARRSELVPELPIAWSPDGSRLAVAGFRAGSIRLYVVSAAGGGYHLVPASGGGIFPVFSADGSQLAFTVSRPEFGSEIATDSADEIDGTAIRVVDLRTGKYRMLTPWRDGLRFVAGSYSPDGSTLLTTRVRGERREEVVAIDLGTGGRRLLLAGAAEPVYSPDGTSIAFVREYFERRQGGAVPTADLFVAASDGSSVLRVTRTPEEFEYLPSWDPSGERIAFTAFPQETGEGRELPAWIGQVNADGTCLQTLRRGVAANFYGAAWRPGPGREAGRIVC